MSDTNTPAPCCTRRPVDEDCHDAVWHAAEQAEEAAMMLDAGLAAEAVVVALRAAYCAGVASGYAYPETETEATRGALNALGKALARALGGTEPEEAF
jgi:hypothetical protein